MSGGAFGGYSGNCGHEDFHSVAASLRQLTNLIDEAKRLGLLGAQYGWFGSPVQAVQDGIGSLCAALDNVSCQLDVVAKALNRFSNSVEGLAGREPPIVFVEEEAAQRRTGSQVATQENGNGYTADVADRVHMNLDRQGRNKVEERDGLISAPAFTGK